jgi:hypothetical protein
MGPRRSRAGAPALEGGKAVSECDRVAISGRPLAMNFSPARRLPSEANRANPVKRIARTDAGER